MVRLNAVATGTQGRGLCEGLPELLMVCLDPRENLREWPGAAFPPFSCLSEEMQVSGEKAGKKFPPLHLGGGHFPPVNTVQYEG